MQLLVGGPLFDNVVQSADNKDGFRPIKTNNLTYIMKRVLSLFIGLLLFSPVFSQNLRFDVGKKYVSEDGLTSYSSEASLLKILNPMVYMNLVSREVDGNNEYFVVISLPVKTLGKVSEDSSLQLNLANGSTMELPVNERVVWDASKAPEKKSTEVYLINIPYRITKDQIDLISSTAVSKMSIPGIEKTISFSIKGQTMSNVMKRQFQEIDNLANGGSNAPQSQNSAIAQSRDNNTRDIQTKGVKKDIFETPNTKTFIVSSLDKLQIGNCHEGYIIVVEDNTHEVHIFDSDGNNTGNYTRKYPVYDASKLNICDGVIVDELEAEKYCVAAMDVNGNVIFSESANTTDFVDGLALRTGTLYSEPYYIDKRGTKVYPTNGSSVYIPDKVYADETRENLYPLSCGRRRVIIQTGTAPSDLIPGGKVRTYSYGYLDEKLKLVLPAKYEDAMDFSEGLAAICQSKGDQEYWGYIDINGSIVIPAKFSNRPGNFHNGFAKVTKTNRRIVFINKKGDAVSPEYLAAGNFYNGYAWVITDNNGRQSKVLINTNFEVVSVLDNKDYEGVWIPLNLYSKGDDYRELFTGNLVFKKGDHTSIAPFTGPVTGYSRWSSSSKTERGLVNSKGEIILKFIESEF